jgi:hypothetical protein
MQAEHDFELYNERLMEGYGPDEDFTLFNVEVVIPESYDEHNMFSPAQESNINDE